MKSVDNIFKEQIKFILESPESSKSDDRTGTGTIKNPILPQMVFDLRDGFPLLSLKKTSFNNIFHELKWFLMGDTNIKYLVDNKCNIWTDNAYDHYLKNTDFFVRPFTKQTWLSVIKDGVGSFGDLGPVYGAQWRNLKKPVFSHNVSSGSCFTFDKVDQIQNVLDQINNNPSSRRIIVSAWNPVELDKMALPPCHMQFQFLVHGDDMEKLSLVLYVRSNDWLLGAPYNIASYALLLETFAAITGKTACFLRYNVGDAHIYNNHIDGANVLLERESKEMPTLSFKGGKDKYIGQKPWDMELDWFSLDNYDPHPILKLKMAV